MDFSDPDFVLAKAAEGFGGGFELHGEVAAVVIDAEMFVDTQVSGAIGAKAMEEIDGFRRGFEGAEGLGFEIEVERVAGSAGSAFDMFDRLPEMISGDLKGAVVGMETFEGNRGGADAAFHACRENFSKDIEEQAGVIEAIGLGPVGDIDLFFDAGPVELAERESVDGENVALLMIEPASEGVETGRVVQFAGGASGEA